MGQGPRTPRLYADPFIIGSRRARSLSCHILLLHMSSTVNSLNTQSTGADP